MISLAQSATLRAGIKWDPLERDHLMENVVLNTEKSHLEMSRLSSQLKFLWWWRKALFATYIFRNRSRRLNRLAEAKKKQIKVLQKYLDEQGIHSYDLDLCCCCFNRQGTMVKYISPRTVEARDTVHGQMAFVHSGDDETGTGSLFDEEIRVRLAAIDPQIHKVFFVIASLHHGFHEISGCTWSFMTTQDEKVVLSASAGANTSHRIYVMAKLVRKELSWALSEIAQHFPLEIDRKKDLSAQLDDLIRQRYLIKNPACGCAEDAETISP